MFSDIRLYITAIMSFAFLDSLWLGLVMKNFYLTEMQAIARIQNNKFQPVYWAVVATYIVMTLAVVHFSLPRTTENHTYLHAFGLGALLGFVLYGTYDFTNYSTLKNWSLSLTLVDLGWGAFVMGAATCVTRIVRDTLL